MSPSAERVNVAIVGEASVTVTAVDNKPLSDGVSASCSQAAVRGQRRLVICMKIVGQ